VTAVRVKEQELAPFFTYKTLAAYLAISERTARQLIFDGKLDVVRVGGQWRISAAAVEEYVAANTKRRR
jgi:excisionase family DNA binding protein